MVAGPSAGTYCTLTGLYTNKGRQANRGAHQIGEFDGIPLFKVPSSIIPTNEILTIWKDDENESDVSIAFGTLVPFFNTGIVDIVPPARNSRLKNYLIAGNSCISKTISSKNLTRKQKSVLFQGRLLFLKLFFLIH